MHKRRWQDGWLRDCCRIRDASRNHMYFVLLFCITLSNDLIGQKVATGVTSRWYTLSSLYMNARMVGDSFPSNSTNSISPRHHCRWLDLRDDY